MSESKLQTKLVAVTHPVCILCHRWDFFYVKSFIFHFPIGCFKTKQLFIYSFINYVFHIENIIWKVLDALRLKDRSMLVIFVYFFFL